MNVYDENEIVISGIGGHFPECDTLDELKENLLNSVDMVTSDRPRWEPGELSVPIRTGKMKTLDRCDAQYFGLIGKQCQALDPITRKVLERTYEAVYDAGLNPSDLAGTNTGVFFGTSILETEMSLMESKSSDAYNILGRNKTMNANRVSYWLDLKGPSFALDSSWSSGLQTLALAFEYMQSGLCKAAFVAAGSSIIHAEYSRHFDELHMLSPDGSSRSFDNGANGFARSEAVVVLLLQKAKDAKRNHGVVVHAVGKAMNYAPGHLLLPRKEEWLQLYHEFYSECNVDPKEVTFIEADGMACREADAAELNAVNEFFCRNRNKSNPLLIGSIKTNIGHTMATAGLCSLVKILITNQTGTIPPNLYYASANKLSTGLTTGKIKVVTEPTRLDGELLAVNSFGFGGTYCHCLIRRPAQVNTVNSFTQEDGDVIPRLVLLSGRNEEGIKSTLDKVEAMPYSDECIKLVHDIFSKPMNHHMYRGYTLLPKKEASLRNFDAYEGEKRPVWFIFTGMGSHWPSMGRDLKNFPVFKDSINLCHRVLSKKGLDLWSILTTEDATMFDNIMNSFVGICSMQIALVDILHSLGIKPDGIIGHSAGEVAAAYSDGCLTREEAILCAYSRGKVSNEVKVIKGMMAAVGKGYEEMKDSLPEHVEVACHNSPTNCTISGPSETVKVFAEKLKSDGIFVRTVNVSNIAYHSKHIRNFGPRLKEELSKIIIKPKLRSAKWISSSVPKNRWDEPEWQYCSPEYLTNNLLSPVLFEEACRHIPKNAIVIEIAPHGLLLSVLKRSLDNNCISLSLTHRNAPNEAIHLLQAIGKLYMVGLQPQVSMLYPKVNLPVPVEIPFLGTLATWEHSFSWGQSNERSKNRASEDFTLNLDELPHYKSYRLDDQLTLPYSVVLGLVMEVFAKSKKKSLAEMSITFTDIVFREAVRVRRTRSVTLAVMNLIGSGRFEVLHDGRIIVAGCVNEWNSGEGERSELLERVENPKVTINESEFYTELSQYGHEYGEPLRIVTEMNNDGCSWESRIRWTIRNELFTLIEAAIQSSLIASVAHFDQLQQLRQIREISLDLNILKESTDDIFLTLNTTTEVMQAPGINVVGITFMAAAPTSKCDMYPATTFIDQVDDELDVSFVEHFARDVKSKQLGYSGRSSSSIKIMGIGSIDEATSAIIGDGILRWQVPETWTMENATTVPIPYCLAFYMLKVLAKIRASCSVLVTNGSSSIGLACIAVAAHYTKSVFTVVTTEKDKLHLENMFPQLIGNVFVVEAGREDQLYLDLRKRISQKLIDIFINTSQGINIGKYLDCVSAFGRLYQVFAEETDPTLQFYGTDNLLRFISIYGISLQSVLDCSNSDKKFLHELLSEGIKTGLVVPLPMFIKSQSEANHRSPGFHTELVRIENHKRPSEVLPNSEKYYLIMGGHMQMILTVAARLIKKQAKKLMILHWGTSLSSNAAAKIKILQQTASLSVKQINPYDEEATKGAMRDLKNIDAAIVLPDMQENGKDPTYPMIQILTSKFSGVGFYLVCVLRSSSRGVNLCIERSRNGEPTLMVRWDGQENGKLSRLVRGLDQFVSQCKDGVMEISHDIEDKEDETDIDELLSYLPKSAEELAEYGMSIPVEVSVTEIRTLSPALQHTKETLPVFLVAGLTSKTQLTKKFRYSFYPTFVVSLPHLGGSTLEEMAAYAIPKMKSITSGPYIVIAERWGGCIALEIARQLERLGHVVHTFLLSGTPEEVIKPLKLIASTSESLECSLLTKLLQIEDSEVLQELSDEDDWMTKMHVSTRVFDSGFRESVMKGLDAIKCRLAALQNYIPSNPLNGPLSIITKKNISLEHLKQLSKGNVQMCEVSGDNDILNEEVFRMVHDTALHKTIKR